MRVALIELDSESTEPLDAMDGDLNHLNHLTTGLVDLGRINSDNERTRHELGKLVEDVIAPLDGLSPHCTVRVGERASVHVWANPHLLQTAIRALVSNATAVCVSVHHDRDEAVITVEDNGPGVPTADRDRLFDPKVRGSEARDHGDPHLGLGLSTATRIIESHGGHVDVTDSPMGGACFRVRMPMTHGA